MVSTGTEVKEVLTAGLNIKVEFPVNPKILFCDTNSTSSVLNARTGKLSANTMVSSLIRMKLFLSYYENG